MASIEIVAAVADNLVIGKDKEIPWYLPEDLRHFKAITTSYPIIMGRRTLESIGRALPSRRNIVVTSAMALPFSNIELASSLNEAIDLAKEHSEKVMVIGGACIYKEALPLASVLHITHIHKEFAGDTYFPDFRSLPFVKKESESFYSETLGCEYSFETYVRA